VLLQAALLAEEIRVEAVDTPELWIRNPFVCRTGRTPIPRDTPFALEAQEFGQILVDARDEKL
jgi:hypothetical protein